MSMIGNFLAIPQSQLDTLIANPDSVADFLYSDEGGDAPKGLLDIDKAWHGIHFLLTGCEWEGPEPWSLVVLGGTPIGPDIGYGPARYLLPSQVREVARALADLPRDELAKRFEPASMDEAGIYPQIWERDADDGLEYLLSYYDNVVAYYQRTSAQDDAMLLYLT